MDAQQLLKNSGHNSLLPLQSDTIDAFNVNDHVQLIAQTGSGKTLAFLLSVLSNVNPSKNQALILAPTRELALQIFEVCKSLRSGFSLTVCYGGHPVKTERNELAENPTIIIATPGRILDHLKRGNVQLHQCSSVVIDEFDKCLEYGFEKEMNDIRSHLPDRIKTIFVSATKLKFTPKAWEAQKTKILDFSSEGSPQGLEQFTVKGKDSFNALLACLNHFGTEPSVVFCNYREVADDVCRRLNENGHSTVSYHGGMDQSERELSLIKYRNGSKNTLVCTDLGSRGLDIESVKHVIHYQFPDSKAAYIHRNGRTARANEQGAAYILFNSDQSLPEYLELPENEFVPDPNRKPSKPKWSTLYFGAGKKDKLRKMDIVGFLSKQGKLKPDEIGRIDIMDKRAFAAIAKNKMRTTMDQIHNQRIKGKRVVIKKAK